MINVTKTFLPSFEEYTTILKRAWDKAWLTNNGELVQELEQNLRSYLGINNLLFTNNGTVVLQMALKALNITKEVITTPFSYVATTNAILWEGCTPVFVDIEPDTFCIDPTKIEAAITENTQAILATHVFGFPCDVEKIATIAEKYNLKVIYDGAHAFGCTYKGKSLLSYGDIATCSFHATKLFHTVEGGCIICNDEEVAQKIFLYRQFGHIGDDYFSVGINAKNSEFHAAMGLAVLPKVKEIIAARKNIFSKYDDLKDVVCIPNYDIEGLDYNYSYYPVLIKNEEALMAVKESLLDNQINARRYFYPSLNLLPQIGLEKTSCPISEEISSRILCLPLYYDLNLTDQKRVMQIITQTQNNPYRCV